MIEEAITRTTTD